MNNYWLVIGLYVNWILLTLNKKKNKLAEFFLNEDEGQGL